MTLNTAVRTLKLQGMVLIGLLALTLASASAEPQLDFQLGGGAGGTISWAGGDNPLVGANIPIRLLTSSDTPLNDGDVLDIDGGVLNFMTGSLSSSYPGLLLFDGPGYFSITGGISSLGIASGSTLLSGTFTGAAFVPWFFGSSITLGGGQDTKHEAIVTRYFGPSYTPPWQFAGLIGGDSVMGQLLRTGSFATEATSVDILNTALPEPASMMLLGTALLGIGIIARRRWQH